LSQNSEFLTPAVVEHVHAQLVLRPVDGRAKMVSETMSSDSLYEE
jgi:hypothetical protein